VGASSTTLIRAIKEIEGQMISIATFSYFVLMLRKLVAMQGSEVEREFLEKIRR
jgi:hypothetical protein